MDVPLHLSRQQSHARDVSGEYLEVLGKKAAADWDLGRYATLNDAVIETVKSAGLSPQQVQRVVEFTNSSAYLTSFAKQGSSGHKVVEFPGGPADPSFILKDLNDGGGGETLMKGASDYSLPPVGYTEKTAASDEVEAAFEEMFKTSGPTELQDQNPLSDSYDLRTKLAGARDLLTSQMTMVESMHYDLREGVFNEVKKAAMDGTSLGEIVYAWMAVSPSDEHIKLAMSGLYDRLIQNEVFRDREALSESLSKLASEQIVNLEHPLVTSFREYSESLSKLAELRAARDQIEAGYREIDEFVSKAAADPGVVRRVMDAAERGGKKIAPKAQWVAEKLLGEGSDAAKTVGKATGKAIEYAPVAAAAVGANEVRRHLKYNPHLQGPKNAVLAVTPGTQQYNERSYRIASGQ
jgi:hypothetical protein